MYKEGDLSDDVFEGGVAEELSYKKFSSTLSCGMDPTTRTVYLIGEIDEKMAFHFMCAISHLDATSGNIRLVISSPGGIEHYGYAMYDLLRHTNNTVIAEGFGTVASMGAAIFQGADVRYLSENCEYLIHNGSLEVGTGHIEQDKIQDLADRVRIDLKKYYQILYDNSDLSMEEIKDYCDEEKSFTAQESVNAGLADFVMKPNKSKIRKKKRKKGKR